MDKPSNDNHAAGAIDTEDADLYRNETDRALHGDDDDALDPDDLPNAEAVKATLRYSRDSYIVKPDVDPDQDNDAPGIRGQD